jgi:acetyl esterase/lipase
VGYDRMFTLFRGISCYLSAMRWIALLCFLGALPVSAESPTERWSRDVSYRDGETLDDYSRDRCKLDIYAPAEGRDLPVVVWIHGGGLRGGKKKVPEALRGQGLVVVAPNYRLHPKVKAPAYIEDVAAAVAWTFENIGSYGGSSEKIVVSGHSAGGYLASMVGLDKRWLAKHEIDADRIAGLAPL